MADIRLTTDRLELIAATVESLHAEIEHPARFARLMDARVPPGWPPPLNDETTLRWTLRYLEETRDAEGWGSWYFVLKDDGAGRRLLVGLGGFKGKPSADGTVEVGYSIMEEHQRRGYATEAVRGLIAWAFSHPEVTRVIAETLPELKPSIRIMEKSGLAFLGEGSEKGVIRYELPRTRFTGR